MEQRSKDLLHLEQKNLAPSSIESTLLVCNKSKGMASQSRKPYPDGKPLNNPVPQSQVMGRVKDFLGVMAEANKRLELDAKENSGKSYDIEELTGNESEYIEMDLMLGVADLHTPEAVAAAEAAIAGSQPVIALAGASSESESESESDDSSSDEEDDNTDDVEKADRSTCLPSNSEGPKSVKAESLNEALGKHRNKKRQKIVELS
ncbi:NOP protein chaperone 1 [Dillenia turbinata]|uniref:NOP protein chaperone 1 n=1 Tax=Dillenia turbinata TaxID=194707 RepID=A0AAN8W466_9MAGN